VAELISMPKLGFDMAEGMLQEWLKKAGDAIAEGETLAIIETDKASVEVPAFRSGVLISILVEAGMSVPIGTPIAVIGNAGEAVDLAALGQAVAPTPPPPGGDLRPARVAVKEPEPQAPTAVLESAGLPAEPEGGHLMASPVAVRMAGELSIDLKRVTGTGPG
jgi:pyruvate dehydrogenase E2 component (dihydrolipoamide acetyltransferase)